MSARNIVLVFWLICRGVFFFGYWGIVITQYFATMKGLIHFCGIKNFFLQTMIFMFSWVMEAILLLPLVLGIYGAQEVWGWSFWQAVLLYAALPFIGLPFAGLLSEIEAYIDRTRK